MAFSAVVFSLDSQRPGGSGISNVGRVKDINYENGRHLKRD